MDKIIWVFLHYVASLFSAHGIELKQVWACLPFRQKCLFYFRLLILETLYSLPGLKDILNFLVLRGTDFFFQMRKKSSSSKTE